MTLNPFIRTIVEISPILNLSLNGTSEFMFRPQFLIQPRTSYAGVIASPSEKLKKPSTKAIISLFRDDGLPLSAIADMARVERKTVYSWLKGGIVRLENQQRLDDLYDLFFTNKQAPLLYLYRYWNQKAYKDLSIKNLVTEKDLNLTSIRQALLELWPLAKKYQADLRQSYRESNEDEGQHEAINEWDATLTDGSDEW